MSIDRKGDPQDFCHHDILTFDFRYISRLLRAETCYPVGLNGEIFSPPKWSRNLLVAVHEPFIAFLIMDPRLLLPIPEAPRIRITYSLPQEFQGGPRTIRQAEELAAVGKSFRNWLGTGFVIYVDIVWPYLLSNWKNMAYLWDDPGGGTRELVGLGWKLELNVLQVELAHRGGDRDRRKCSLNFKCDL